MPMPDQHFHFIRNSGEPPTHAQCVSSLCMHGPLGPQAERWVQRRTGLYHHLIEDTPHAVVGLAQVTGIPPTIPY